MQYIVLDFEWNQSIYGKKSYNEELPFEIIEVGAIKLDDKFKEISSFCSVIKPEVYKKVSPIISKITRLSPEILNQGRGARKVFNEFLQWCGDDYIFCTWGSTDIYELQRNLSYFRIKSSFPFPLFYYDVQKIYSLQYEDGKQRSALNKAIESLGIVIEDDFHRALSDAKYTVDILRKIDFNKFSQYTSIDNYTRPLTPEQEIYINYGNYSKYISIEFDNKNIAMECSRVTTTRCNICNKNARKKLHWFSDNSKNYYCVAYCKEHGFLQAKIRMKKINEDKVYVVKTIKVINEEKFAEIKRKKQLIQKKRLEKKLAEEKQM